MAMETPRRRFVAPLDFLRTRRRVSRLQSLGLVILGFNLVVGGILVWIVKFAPFASSTEPGAKIVAALGIIPCAFLMYLGCLHIKRAFAGRSGKAHG